MLCLYSLFKTFKTVQLMEASPFMVCRKGRRVPPHHEVRNGLVYLHLVDYCPDYFLNISQ